MTAAALTLSQDGLTLLACDVESGAEEVIIPEGVQAIADKAFMYMETLRHVQLPSTLEVVGDYAFSCTSLEEFMAPAALKHVGSKAFFRCQKLGKVVLNEGLESILDEAFSSCGSLRVLTIPSTVISFGRNVTYATDLVYNGPGTTFQMAPGNKELILDSEGGLYRRNPDGTLELMEMLSYQVQHHHVLENTTVIGDFAYLSNRTIQRVTLPPGVKRIGESAFRKCSALHTIDIPDSLGYIGNHAFFQTSLTSVKLPSGLEYLGVHALVTGDQERGSTLQNVELGSGNLKFFVESDILCERKLGGTAFAVVFFGHQSQVRLPHSVTSIGPYCFSTITGVEEIVIHAGIDYIHPCGFPAYRRVPALRIELEEPVCGRDYVILRNVSRATFLNSNAHGEFNVERLCNQSDRELLTVNFVYPRTLRMLERLECPQFLDDGTAEVMMHNLDRNIKEIILAFARHGYIGGIERLADCGVITQDNISDIIDFIRGREFTAMTGCLLEMKKSRFKAARHSVDFSL